MPEERILAMQQLEPLGSSALTWNDKKLTLPACWMIDGDKAHENRIEANDEQVRECPEVAVFNGELTDVVGSEYVCHTTVELYGSSNRAGRRIDPQASGIPGPCCCSST